MPTETLRKPKKRVCERCGRQEVWDEDAESWRIREVEGDRKVGNKYCIHEWDINGAFVPFDH